MTMERHFEEMAIKRSSSARFKGKRAKAKRDKEKPKRKARFESGYMAKLNMVTKNNSIHPTRSRRVNI
jgi:hypothetical protein